MLKLYIPLLLFFTIQFTDTELSALPQSARSDDIKKLVESHITAFNGGEETMRGFITENFSKTALDQAPVAMRLQTYRRMHADLGSIALHRIEEITSTSVTAYIHSNKNEWLLFTYILEGSPFKIGGIRIEEADSPEEADAPKIKEIAALQKVARLLDDKSKNDEFSGSVLIARNGKAVFRRAYGLASKEFNIPNGPETKFNLGSINKIFTQIAVGQLYEEGKLSLSDPIGKILTDYPNKIAAEKVTVRHLLDMSSGVGDFFGEKFESTPKDKFRGIADFLPMFADDSLEFEPGSRRQYSNGGYIVLGAIIERVTGQSYYEYVKEHIFKKAGMPNTDSYEADAIVANLAEGYTRDDSGTAWRKNIYTRPARGSSAGGGYSNTEDLLKFTIALENNKFFKDPGTWPALRGEAGPTTPPPGNAGNRNQPARGGLGIFGGAPGINAGVETGIGKGYTAIVMSNYDPPSAQSIMKEIKRFLKRVR